MDQQSEDVEDFTYACGDDELGSTTLFLNDAIVTLMWGVDAASSDNCHDSDTADDDDDDADHAGDDESEEDDELTITRITMIVMMMQIILMLVIVMQTDQSPNLEELRRGQTGLLGLQAVPCNKSEVHLHHHNSSATLTEWFFQQGFVKLPASVWIADSNTIPQQCLTLGISDSILPPPSRSVEHSVLAPDI